jgi:hypothetical protein
MATKWEGSMEGNGWEKFGPKKKKVEGQHANKLTMINCWLM